MRETIILSNIDNKNLLKTLGTYNVNTFNLRIINAFDLASEALLRSGIVVKNRIISEIECECIIHDIIKDNDYFKGNSLEDVKYLAMSINSARMLCRKNENEKINEVFLSGTFINKNKSFLDVYNKYKQYLSDNNLEDRISIINKAIELSSELNSDFLCLKETPLMPLEEELLKVVSNNKIKETSVVELASKEIKELSEITYDSAYGSINEIEHVIGYIARNKIKYEDSLIVLANPGLLSHIKQVASTYNVDICVGLGNPITNSAPAKVLYLIDKWERRYNSTSELYDLFNANEFDSDKFFNNIAGIELSTSKKNNIIKSIGSLKLKIGDNTKKISDYERAIYLDSEIKLKDYVINAAKELSKGYTYILETYTKIIDESIDIPALNKILILIKAYIEETNTYKLSDIIKDILDINVRKEVLKPKAIYVTDLKGALSVIRKHIFICGLSSKFFPGSPKENFILLDSDLERFKEEKAFDSHRKIFLNKQLLIDVIKNASAFDSKIHLSYASYNISELKDENPSSMLFEIYKMEHGEKASIDSFEEKIGISHAYFEECLSSLRNIGQNYINGIDIDINDDDYQDDTPLTYSKEISPSGAEKFFECPKCFYLKYILGIKEPEDDDPLIIMPANDMGTLIHECMEDYGNNPSWTKEKFINNAEDKFDKYLKKRVPLEKGTLKKIKSEYRTMVETGYDGDPHNEVYASEIKLGPIEFEDTGLVFGGRVDRIEKLENGNYVIVDYKTYEDVKNFKDDVDSCLQTLIYAYLFEKQKGVKVERCEYRYLRNKRTVTCTYNEKFMNTVKERLLKIKKALDSGYFECVKEEDCNRYCKYKDICRLGIKKVKNSEGEK